MVTKFASAAFCAGLYFLCLGLTAFGLRRCLPLPEVPIVRPKLDWLARQGDDFDIVFIGSSRVEMQVVPSVFDQTAAELGRPVRAFNAGVSAMVPPETDYMIEQILKRPHRRLRWVAIEVMPLTGQYDPMLAGTTRIDYWHDFRRLDWVTRRAVEELARALGERSTHPKTWQKHCADVIGDEWKHLGSFARRSVNFGRGAEILASHWRGRHKPGDFENGGPAGDGWAEQHGPQLMEGEMLAAYQRQLVERAAAPVSVQDDISEAALGNMIDLLKRHGIETILFLPPAITSSRFYPAHLANRVPLFDFSDTVRYAALYSTEHHKDGVHLNTAGARVFSRELAALFVERTKLPSATP